jgi:hypothetical protein
MLRKILKGGVEAFHIGWSNVNIELSLIGHCQGWLGGSLISCALSEDL